MKPQIVLNDCRTVLSNNSKIDIKKNIFITGASGMLGSYAVEFFLALRKLTKLDLKIFITLRNRNEFLLNLISENRNVISDLSVLDFETKLFELGDDKLLIHCASPANLSAVISNPENLLETNLIQVMKFANIFSKTGGKINFFSSGEVYGHSPKLPTSETDFSTFNHLEIGGIYGESKKMAEMILYLHSLNNQFNFDIYRIFHTFGPGLKLTDTRIFGSILESLYYRKPILLRSDGSARRTLMYSGDLLQAILITNSRPENLVLNIAGDKEYSILELAQIASNLVSPKLEIITSMESGDNRSNNSIRRAVADTTKLASMGWKALFDIETGFSRTLESFSERNYGN
jgi:UDP-glucuronate decarboxylase